MVINTRKQRPKPLVLVVMDGIGAAGESEGNAVTKANTPMLRKIWQAFPHGYLEASGEAVGLPKKIRGNSEVGHTNIGAGRIVFQDLPRINRSIENGVFFSNSTLAQAVQEAIIRKTKIHILGCISDGQVHSSIDHFAALLKFITQRNVHENVYLHAFTDGRDAPPTSGKDFIQKAIDLMSQAKVGKIASIVGRYFAMDRNDQWDRTQIVYNLLTQGKGEQIKESQIPEMFDKSYANKETDEFLQAKIIVNEQGQEVATIKEGDIVIFMNYRADRAIQLSQAFTMPDFNSFNREVVLNNLYFATMTEYTPDLPILPIFPPEDVRLPLGRIISNAGLRQLRIAESEKFPHVTYFFNGGRDIRYDGEDRIEVRSPEVATYDLKPEMSANEVTEIILEKLGLNIYDFILVNYANGDMVGHTGVLDAGIKAVETVDYCLRRLVPQVLRVGGELVITSDHGNVEEMLNLETGQIDTMHSFAPVPIVHVSKMPNPKKLQFGILSDIAPTVMNLMGIEKSEDMTSKNLLS